MSEALQEVDTSEVTDDAVQNEHQVQDESQNTEEVNAEDTEVETSMEAETEPELTPEEKLEQVSREAESMQKKIKRQTAAYNDLQRKFEAERKEYQEAQAKLQAEEPSKAPNIDDYSTYDEYIEAVAQFNKEEGIREAKKLILEEQQQANAQRIMQERLNKKAREEAEYIKQNPQYTKSVEEVESYVKTAQFPQAVEAAVIEQIYRGNVPHVIDYFGRNNGENLDKLQSLSNMTPVEAAIEIYKIQQSVGAPNAKKETITPKPVRKPTGTGGKPQKNLRDGDVLKNLGLK